jgi:hypothetical protein
MSEEAKQYDLFEIPDDQVDDEFVRMANEVLGETSEEVQEEEETPEVEPEESDEDGSESSSEALEDDTEPEEGGSSPEAPARSETSYKEAYDAIFAPFKANGKEMKVDNIEDVRTLMQMGANYNKKMAAIKPSLKIVKLLEKNDLLDENKLNFLIDLQNKNPEAISKLIKDTGIDPLELDLEKAESYKPKSHAISDKEVELEGILEELKETESFSTTADIISTKWDVASRKVLFENPQLIKWINTHVGNGIFEQISNIVEKERILGRLTGISDIEAYKYVGDALNSSNKFNTGTVKPTPKVTNNGPAIKDRKKAAGTTKSATTSKQTADFNPLSMSDEEFEKMANSKFI